MKRKILGMLFCLIAFSVYAAAPAFDGGTVVSVKDVSNTFRRNIVLTNYSSVNEINIEFYIYKDSGWQTIGGFSDCPFGKGVKLSSKENLSKINFIAYKSNLPDNKKIFVESRNHDLRFYILESSNSIFGTSTSFANLKESYSNGIYKFDTANLRRNYEDNIKVENAPKCIIMFQSPDYGTWDVYGIVIDGKIKSFYNDDLDSYTPQWVIQILEEHKIYNISAYAKHSDLYFKFMKSNAKEEVAESKTDVEAQLLKLKQLYDGGLIDEDEYKEKKSKVLGL